MCVYLLIMEEPRTKTAMTWILSCFFVFESNHTQLDCPPVSHLPVETSTDVQLGIAAGLDVPQAAQVPRLYLPASNLKMWSSSKIYWNHKINYIRFIFKSNLFQSLTHTTLQLHLGPSVSVHFRLFCLALQYHSPEDPTATFWGTAEITYRICIAAAPTKSDLCKVPNQCALKAAGLWAFYRIPMDTLNEWLVDACRHQWKSFVISGSAVELVRNGPLCQASGLTRYTQLHCTVNVKQSSINQ